MAALKRSFAGDGRDDEEAETEGYRGSQATQSAAPVLWKSEGSTEAVQTTDATRSRPIRFRLFGGGEIYS
jgi:hypothetical protein